MRRRHRMTWWARRDLGERGVGLDWIGEVVLPRLR